MATFDPNAAASADSGIFGLPFSEAEARLVYVPVPWEPTTSYGGGTSLGPNAIFQASKQVDLFDFDVEKPYEPGLFMRESSKKIHRMSEEAKALAQKIIEVGGDLTSNPGLKSDLEKVNALGEELNRYVEEQTLELMQKGKIVGLIGGDHSVPMGAFQAVARKHKNFGILHLDAHSDTRKAYEGFTWSHASIMYNALDRIPEIGKLVQVGIRDFCEEEVDYCKSQGERVRIFFDRDLARRQFEGTSWANTCDEIVSNLPQEVWISFDIDGLDPQFCPHTGTPVPGGLSFQQANYLFRRVVQGGKRIIGFDLNEVAPNLDDENDDWDANVGARMLYKLTAWTLASQGLAKVRSV